MNITVRDYLKLYPDLGLDLLTPGLVRIPPQLGRELLSPGGSKMKSYVCGTKGKVVASSLLEQRICKIIRYRNDSWRVFLLTNQSSSPPNCQMEALYEQSSFLTD